ncbi:winged helix-turn-helix transcriptional regulator, partial [Nocardia sp. NPDC050175]|uniref:WXG100-like domain-containing protein n=1 Tax=Nocardia sp. NPDC050175 TaxID=3364317 RepID=UPI0037B2E3B6
MSIEMPAGLQWLSIFAGSNWPKGDEDAMFSLDGYYHTAAEDLEAQIGQLRAACDKALANYSGPASDQMKRQFDLFFTGDTSVATQVKGLRQLGTAAHEMGVSIEHAKLQIIITLALLAAEIAYLLTTWFGAAMVPVAEAEAQIAIAGFGRALLARLSQHAAWMAKLPMWKLAGISGLVQGGLGLLTEVAIEGIQKDKGHINSFDLKQIFVAGATGAAGGAVGAPVGSIIGKRFGNWVGQESMTTLKATGIAFVSGVGGGLAGVGAGFVAGGALTGEWDFDPVMLAGGAAGGALGAMHGAVGHLNAAALNKTHGAVGEQKPISLYSNDAKFSDGSSITSGSDRSDGAGGGGSEATNSRGAADRPGSSGVGSISAKSLLPGRSGSVDGRYGDGSASTISASSTPNGNGAHQSSSAPPPVTRGVEVKPEPATSSPGPQGSQATVNHSDGVSRNGGSVGPDTHSSGGLVSRHPGEFTPAESHTRPAGEFDSRGPVSNGSESHGSTQHEPPASQAEPRRSSKASSIDSGSDSQSRGRSTDGVSGNGSRVGSEISTRPSTPEVEPVRGRSGAPITSASDGGSQARITAASDGGSQARITAAHNESGPVGQRPVVAREDQSPVSSRAVSPERAVGPAAGPPRPESPAGHSGSGSEAGSIHMNRNSGDDARAHSETVVPERKNGLSHSEPDDQMIRRPRAHLSENNDGQAISEQHHSGLQRDHDGQGQGRTEPPPPVRPAAKEPMSPHELKLRDQLRTEVAAGDQTAIGARERLNAAVKELDNSSRALESVRAEKDRAPDAVAHAESRHEAARTVHDAAKAEHDAAVEHAVQERYEELKTDSEARVFAANQDRLSMLKATDAQMDIAVKDLRTDIADLKHLRNLHEMEKAQLEVSLNHSLDENIKASKDKVAQARETFENSKKEYEEARSGNEPRAEYLKQLDREVKQSRKHLRDEMIEHEALLTAAKDRREELAAARNDRGELASDRRRRWVFNRRVEQQSAVWERVLSRRESDATAESRVAELGEKLAAKEAAYPEAVAKFKREMHKVLEKRFAGLGTAKVADRDAYMAGLADQREAMAAASRKALESGDAVVKAAFVYRDEVLRRTGETDPVIGRGANDAEVDAMVRNGSRAEQVAAMAEWMTRHDPNPEQRTPRKTQMLAYVLTEFGPADMKGGEGKTLVMVMSGYRDAMKHGAETILTSSEPLVVDMIKEVQGYLGTHEEHRAGLKDMGVDLVQLREDEPFPQWAWDAKESGRNLLIVGTKEAVLFMGLHEANSMIEEIGRAGAPKEVVAQVKEWLRTEPPIDDIADRLNAMAEEQKIARRFKPLPEAKVNLDEIDTAFDGEVRAKLSPGADGDAPPATVTQLKDLYEKFQLAMLDHGLTDKDFARPDNTRGLWHARMTEDAIEKLAAVTGDRGSVLAEAEHYTKFANARWGLGRDTDFNTSRTHDKVMQMNASTTDRLMWDSKKSTEVRLEGLGQHLDIVQGVTVRGSRPEDSMTMTLKQWIGSRYLQDPTGVSGTAKEVEGAMHESWGGSHDKRGDYFGVPEVERFYDSNLFQEKRSHFESREAKLAGIATDAVDVAKISFTVEDGTIVGIKQEGQPQWRIHLDNAEISGANERLVERAVDKPGGGRMVEETRIELNRWQDKELSERGVVDWVDAIVEQRMQHYATEHGLAIKEGLKLEHSAIDARWYEGKGGGDVAENAANALIKEFGKPGSIMFINKSGARGTDPKPTAESKALGGVLTGVSGGPAFSPRVLLQAIWRSARGGSGEDQKTGGTPGSAKIYTSNEDFRTTIADAQATREITQYLKAKDEQEHAANEYNADPAAASKQEALNKANERVAEAVRVLEEETTPRLQQHAEEQLLAPHLGPKDPATALRHAMADQLQSSEHPGTYRANAPPVLVPAPGQLPATPLAPPGMDFTTPPPAVQVPEQQAATPEPDRIEDSVDAPGDAGIHHDAGIHGDTTTDTDTHTDTTHTDTTDSDTDSDAHGDTARKVPPAEVTPPPAQDLTGTRNDGNSAITARRSPPNTSPFDGSADSLSRNGSSTFGRSGVSGQSVLEPPVGKTYFGPALDRVFHAADPYSAGHLDGGPVRGFGHGHSQISGMDTAFGHIRTPLSQPPGPATGDGSIGYQPPPDVPPTQGLRVGVSEADDYAHPRNDCGPLAIARLIHRTGNSDIREIDSPGLEGVAFERLEDALGASLRPYENYSHIKSALIDLGSGSTALVVDEYTTVDEHGIGAHAYLITYDNGIFFIEDPGLNTTYEFPPQPLREIAKTRAVLYTPKGISSHAPRWIPVPRNGNQIFEALSIREPGTTVNEIRAGLASRMQQDLDNVAMDLLTPQIIQLHIAEDIRRKKIDAEYLSGKMPDTNWTAETTRREQVDRQIRELRRDGMQQVIDALRGSSLDFDRVIPLILPIAARALALNLIVLRADRSRVMYQKGAAGNPYLLWYMSSESPPGVHVATTADGTTYQLDAQHLNAREAFAPHPVPVTPTQAGDHVQALGRIGNDGVRIFDSDLEGLRFGEARLNRWHELTPQQQHAVWFYDKIALANDYLRSGASRVQSIFEQTERNAVAQRLLSELTRPEKPSLQSLEPFYVGGEAALRQRVTNPAQVPVVWRLLCTLFEHQQPNHLLLKFAGSESEQERISGFFAQFLGMPTHIDSVARLVELIDQANRRPVPISEPLHLVRGLMDIGFMLDMDGNPLGNRDPARLVGTVHTDPGYLSTAVGRDLVKMPDGRVFKYRLNLILPVGGHGLWIGLRSGVPNANELNLPRNTQYRITSVYQSDNLVVLDAEILPPRGYPADRGLRVGLASQPDGTDRLLPLTEPIRLVRSLTDIDFLNTLDGGTLNGRPDLDLLLNAAQLEVDFLSTGTSAADRSQSGLLSVRPDLSSDTRGIQVLGNVRIGANNRNDAFADRNEPGVGPDSPVGHNPVAVPTRDRDQSRARSITPFEPEDGETDFGTLFEQFNHEPPPPPVLDESQRLDNPALTPEQKSNLLPTTPVVITAGHLTLPDGGDAITLVNHRGEIDRLPTTGRANAYLITPPNGRPEYHLAGPDGNPDPTRPPILAVLLHDFTFQPGTDRSAGTLTWKDKSPEFRIRDTNGSESGVIQVPYGYQMVAEPKPGPTRTIRFAESPNWFNVEVPYYVLPVVPVLVARHKDKLYGPGGEPKLEDVRQGNLGDCNLLAALRVMTEPHLSWLLKRILHDNGDGSLWVLLRRRNETNTGWVTKWERVEKSVHRVPGTQSGHYAAHEPGQPLWPAMIEKALAQILPNGYHTLATTGRLDIFTHLIPEFYLPPGAALPQPSRVVQDATFMHPVHLNFDTLHGLVGGDPEFSRQLIDTFHDLRQQSETQRADRSRAINAAHPDDPAARQDAIDRYWRDEDLVASPRVFRRALDQKFDSRWTAEKDAVTAYLHAVFDGPFKQRLLPFETHPEYRAVAEAIADRIDSALRRGIVTLGTGNFGHGLENHTAVPGLIGSHAYGVHRVLRNAEGRPIALLLRNPNRRDPFPRPLKGIEQRLEPNGWGYGIEPDATLELKQQNPDKTITTYTIDPQGTQTRTDPDGVTFTIVRNASDIVQDGTWEFSHPNGSRDMYRQNGLRRWQTTTGEQFITLGDGRKLREDPVTKTWLPDIRADRPYLAVPSRITVLVGLEYLPLFGIVAIGGPAAHEIYGPEDPIPTNSGTTPIPDAANAQLADAVVMPDAPTAGAEILAGKGIGAPPTHDMPMPDVPQGEDDSMEGVVSFGDISSSGVRSVDNLDSLRAELALDISLADMGGGELQTFPVGSVIGIRSAESITELVVTGDREFTAYSVVNNRPVAGVGDVALFDAAGVLGFLRSRFDSGAGVTSITSITVWRGSGRLDGRGQDYNLITALDSAEAWHGWGKSKGLPDFRGGSEVSLFDSNGGVLRLLVTDDGGVFPQYYVSAESKDSLDGFVFAGEAARRLIVDHISRPDRVITGVSVDRPVPGFRDEDHAQSEGSGRAAAADDSPWFNRLTPDQKKAFSYQLAGYSDQQAAFALEMGYSAHQAHIASAYVRLRINDGSRSEKLSAALGKVGTERAFIKFNEEVPHPSKYLAEMDEKVLPYAIKGYLGQQIAEAVGIDLATVGSSLGRLRAVFDIGVGAKDPTFVSALKKCAVARGALTNVDLRAMQALEPPLPLTSLDREILLAYQENPGASQRAISRLVGKSQPTIARRLRGIAGRYGMGFNVSGKISNEEIEQILVAAQGDLAESGSGRRGRGDGSVAFAGTTGEGSYGLSADSDGSAAHARPTQIGASEHDNNCGPALLTHLDTHAPDSARIDHDRLPRGPAGVTHLDIEQALPPGARFHTVLDHDVIAATLRREGPATRALVGINYPDDYIETNEHGIGAHAFLITNNHKLRDNLTTHDLTVTDPANHTTHPYPPRITQTVTRIDVIYLDDTNQPVPPPTEHHTLTPHTPRRIGLNDNNRGVNASLFDGPEDYLLPALFDEPNQVTPMFEPGEGDTYFGALRETIEAGEVTFLGGLSPALQNFGSRREGLQNLVHMLPVPRDQMEMLREHVIRMVEEHFGPDPAFAAAVMPALETAVKKFSQLLSESGEPVSAPHLGNPYPAFLRLSPRVVRRSDDQMAPVSDGPPVGNQRYDSGSTEHGNKHSTSTLRSGAYSYAHGWPVRLGVLRRVGLTGQLAAVYNQLSTNMTVDTTLQVIAKLRSLGSSELYDLLGEWQIRLGHGWHDVFRVRTDDWATVLTAPLQAQFPLYMTRSGELPAIDPGDAATIPAPIERLQREFPLYGVLGIPHIDQLRADTFASFGSYFSDLDTDSREVLLKFFEEEQFCDNFSKMWGDSAPHTDAQDPGFGLSSPILRTNSGEPGYLHIVVEANGGTEIAGPTAKQSRLESYVVRQVGLHGSSTITEMLGASLALTLEFGADVIADDTGHAPPGGRITFRGGASREFSHGLSHQNDAQKQHSLRLAGNDFHNVMTMFTFHVTLVRSFGPPVAPAIRTPLHGGNDYSVQMLVPSLQDLGHAPTKALYPPSNVVHLRQYGMNTTPLGVDGAAGLIAQAREELADRGFIPSEHNTAGLLSWLTHNATVEQQLENRRKFDDMFGPTGLKSAQPGAIEGGVIEWFTLKTPTGVRRFGIEFVTERHYPSDHPYDGASHDWTYDEAQTYNVTSSALSGGEEFSAASPWENYHGGFNVAALTPIVNVTGVYDHSRKNKRIRGAGSGFGEQKFTLSSPGLEVVTLSAIHKVRFIERGHPDETITAPDGSVRVAIPTDDMLTERPAAAPRPPATIRELTAADTRRLALPTRGRTLEDGVLRVPDGAVVQHFIVSKELRKAATSAVSDLRNYYLNYVRTASAAALSDLRDRFQQTDGPAQTMPGAYLADPIDEQLPPEPLVGAEIEVLNSVPEDVVEQQPRPAQPQEHEQQPEPGDTPTQQEQHDIARDTRTEPSMPGAFPADHLEIEAEPAPQVNWPAVGQALLGKAEWVVDQATGVGQWVWRHAFGEPATDPWSKVAEAVHAAFAPEQMMGNALPILQDSLTGEGLFSDGVLAGTSYRWRVRVIVTEPRYLGRHKKNLEHWARRESKFQRSQARQRGHRFGVTPAGRPGESADGSWVPAGSYQYGWTDEDHITASDSTYSSRVRNSNELVHLFGGKLTVVLEVESGTRNPLVNMLPGGPRTVTRAFDVPDGVEFFLDNHDLQDIPELAAIVHENSDYRIPPAPEPDRTLPLSFLETGGHLGYGAVVKATIRPEDETAGSRDVLEDLVMKLVTQLAPGAGQINSSNYLPFLRSVMNTLGTTFGLRTFAYDGPDSRITFGFISRDWPYSAISSLVTFTFSARPDPNVDLSTVLGREVTHPSALDTMLGSTGADSSALPITGATGIGKKRVTSHQVTFNPSLNNEVKTSFSFTGEQQAIQSNERTADTGVASWTQSSGRLRQFPVRYQLLVEVSRRLLTADLKKTLLSAGADIEAFFGRENGIFALNEAELPPPANTVRGSVGLDTLLWFHTSETGNGALTPRIPPSIYSSDPTVPRQAAPPGTIAIDMEIPAELRALVSTAPWMPTNEISLNYFSGARQIADALRQVDPSLRRTDPTRSVGRQTYSSVGVFNLLKQLAATNQLTQLGPAATEAFLGTSGLSDQVPRPQEHADGESVTGTFVKFTIYAPQIDSTSRDIAVHHKRTRKTGEKSTAGHGFGFRPTVGLTNAFTADSTNQGNPSNVPMGGYLDIVEQVSDTVRQDDDLLRQGTTAETATGDGRDSHLFVGVGVAEIVGRRGRLWVPGIVRGYTTALLDAHAPRAQIGPPRPPTLPAPAVLAGTRRRPTYGMGRMGSVVAPPRTRQSVSADGSSAKPAAAVPVQALPPSDNTTVPLQGDGALDTQPDAEAVQQHSEPVPGADPTGTTDSPDLSTDPAGPETVVPAPESEHQLTQITEVDTHSGTQHDGALDNSAEPGAVDQVDESDNLARVEEWRRNTLEAELLGEISHNETAHQRDPGDAPRAPPAGTVRHSPVGAVEFTDIAWSAPLPEQDPERHDLFAPLPSTRLPARPAPAMLAGNWKAQQRRNGQTPVEPWADADGSTTKPAAAAPIRALPLLAGAPAGSQVSSALRPDSEAEQSDSEFPFAPADPEAEHWDPFTTSRTDDADDFRPVPRSGDALLEEEPGDVDRATESDNLARVEEWQRGMLDVLAAAEERLGEASRDDAVHEPDLDQPRAPPTDIVRSSSPTGTVESTGTVRHAPLPEPESTGTEHREPSASPRTSIEDADLGWRQREVEQLTDFVGPLDRGETRGPASLSDRFSSPPRSDDGSVYSDPDRTHDTPLLDTEQAIPAIPFRLADIRSALWSDDDSVADSHDQEPLQHTETTPDDSAAPRDERTSGTDELNQRDPVPVASDDQISGAPHTGDDLATLPQPRDGTTTSTTEQRDLSGTDSSTPIRTSDTPLEQPARRQRTRDRLRGFISRISGDRATANTTTSPEAPHTSSAAPRRGIRAALQRILPETVGSTTLPTARRAAVPAHGDGTTTHSPATTRSLEPTDECLPDTLTDIQHDTNSTAIRPHYRSRALFGRSGRLPGRSRREAEKAAGAKLRGYADEHQIAKELQILGPGAQALVVSEHAAPTANRIGAHAYRMVNDRGVIVIRDATDPTRRFPGDTRAKSFHAVLYTPTGKPTRPLRLPDNGIPKFPRDIRIGAPDDSGFTQQRGFSSAHQNPPGASARSAKRRRVADVRGQVAGSSTAAPGGRDQLSHAGRYSEPAVDAAEPEPIDRRMQVWLYAAAGYSASRTVRALHELGDEVADKTVSGRLGKMFSDLEVSGGIAGALARAGELGLPNREQALTQVLHPWRYLTEAEKDVLPYAMNGYNPDAIAAALNKNLEADTHTITQGERNKIRRTVDELYRVFGVVQTKDRKVDAGALKDAVEGIPELAGQLQRVASNPTTLALTDIRKEIWTYTVAGYDLPRIERALTVSGYPRAGPTLYKHLRKIYEQLGVSDFDAAVERAGELGFPGREQALEFVPHPSKYVTEDEERVLSRIKEGR